MKFEVPACTVAPFPGFVTPEVLKEAEAGVVLTITIWFPLIPTEAATPPTVKPVRETPTVPAVCPPCDTGIRSARTVISFEPVTVKRPLGALKLTEPSEATEPESVKRVAPAYK